MKRTKIKMNLYYFIGLLCLAYFIGTALFVRTGTRFYLIWGVLAAGFLLFGALRQTGVIQRTVPPFLQKTALLAVFLCVLLFAVTEGFIISGFFQKGAPNLDYIIVLGAQVRDSGPSRVLQLRLDEAYAYLEQNPNTVAVVSGGQGSNESQSEAACMKDYLTEKGIGEERIIMEDQSTNTFENLTFSKELIDCQDKKTGIVSNNFHIFRAVKIAEKAGFEHVEGIAAPSYLPLQPNNMLREFFGVVKDVLCGNMAF